MIPLSMIRGKISLFRTVSGRTLFSGSGRVGEEFRNRSVMQHYGFASSPLDGADALIIKQGESVFLIGSDDRRYRISLAPGEVALYDSKGSKVHLKKDGLIEIESAVKVHVNAPEVVIDSGKIFLGKKALAELGGGAVTVQCLCAATGAFHPMGSGTVKAAL